MKSLSFALVVLIWLLGTACVSATPVPPPSPTLAVPSLTAAPIIVPVPSPITPPMTFFLEVLEPANESVVRNPSVKVVGRTVADAVVSADGQPVEVDASGNFSITMKLEEGPNSIEIIANDFQGHQAARILNVIYAP